MWHGLAPEAGGPLALWQVGIAPSEAWGRRKGCNDCITETFRWNPVGNQSHPAEPGPQPEVSRAWRPARAVTKRRQRMPKPCDRAPRWPHPRVAFGVAKPGAAPVHRIEAWWPGSRRGPRTRHRHTRVPQELGTPCDSTGMTAWGSRPPYPRPQAGVGPERRDEDRRHRVVMAGERAGSRS